MTDILRLDDLFRRMDLPLPASDPRTWTIVGQPLADVDLQLVLAATAEDWQAVHDLSCLDGAHCSHNQGDQ